MALKQEKLERPENQPTISMEDYYKKIHKEDKEALLDLTRQEPIDVIPTGSWPINCAIGDGTMKDKPGGFPRGHIVEILGDESSGKSTLALSGIRQAQELGETCGLLDFEYTFHSGYAENLGVSLDKNKLAVHRPMHFQQGARIIKDLLATRPALIVVDSVSAMTPKEVLEGKIDEAGRPGLQAQLMSAFLQYITKFLKASNTCLLFTNQLRMVINMGPQYGPNRGPQEQSSGGNALRFYSSVRINLKKSSVEKVERISKITGKLDKEPVNVTVYASIIKNKVDKPFRSVPVYIRFGEGFDNIKSIIELAVNIEAIKRKGAFYTFEQDKKEIFKVNGKEQLWTYLNENPDVFKKLQSSLVIKEDETVRKQYEEESRQDDMDSMLENVAEAFVEKTEKKKAAKTGKNDQD